MNENSAIEEMSRQERPVALRRPVPWSGFDVFILFFAAKLLTLCCVVAALNLGGIDTPLIKTETVVQNEERSPSTTTDHPLTQLIRKGNRSPLVLLIVFLSAVVAAPLAEEFLFRLVLQGWLESRLNPLKNMVGQVERGTTISSSGFPPGVLSVATTSLFFALLHGSSRSVQSVDSLLAGLSGLAAGNLAVFVLGAVYLSVVRGATLAELGFDRKRLAFDLGLGMLSAVPTIPLVMAVHVALKSLFPDIVTDPVPLFLLALILGTIFFKTGRLTPCIILHAVFNATNFVGLLIYG